MSNIVAIGCMCVCSLLSREGTAVVRVASSIQEGSGTILRCDAGQIFLVDDAGAVSRLRDGSSPTLERVAPSLFSGTSPVDLALAHADRIIVGDHESIVVWKIAEGGGLPLTTAIEHRLIPKRNYDAADKVLSFHRKSRRLIALDNAGKIVSVPCIHINAEGPINVAVPIDGRRGAYVAGDEFGTLVFALGMDVLRFERLQQGPISQLDKITAICATTQGSAVAVARGFKRSSDIFIVSFENDPDPVSLGSDSKLGQVGNLRFHPGGHLLVAIGDRGIGLWERVDGRWARRMFDVPHQVNWAFVNSLQYFKDNLWLAADRKANTLWVLSINID